MRLEVADVWREAVKVSEVSNAIMGFGDEGGGAESDRESEGEENDYADAKGRDASAEDQDGCTRTAGPRGNVPVRDMPA